MERWREKKKKGKTEGKSRDARVGARGTLSTERLQNPVEVGKNTAANVKLEKKSAFVYGEALRPSPFENFSGGWRAGGGTRTPPL